MIRAENELMDRAGKAHLGSIISGLTGATGLFMSCYYTHIRYLEGRKNHYFYLKPVCSCHTRIKSSDNLASPWWIVIMQGDNWHGN